MERETFLSFTFSFMKCIIIGLGNFGMALAQRLTAMGYEVIGVDKDADKVNGYKDSIKNTICLNLNNEQAARNLPLKDADLNIVTLGKDAGASILTVAILKQNGARRILVRAISSLHKTILEAMGISEIIQLEKEYADFFATKTELSSSIYTYQVAPDFLIYEVKLPASFIGRRLKDIQLEKDFSLKIIAIKHYIHDEEKGYIRMEILDNPNEDFIVNPHDIFVLFGRRNRFKALARS